MVFEIVDGENSLGRAWTVHRSIDVLAELQLGGSHVGLGLRIVVLSQHRLSNLFESGLLRRLLSRRQSDLRFVIADVGERRVRKGASTMLTGSSPAPFRST